MREVQDSQRMNLKFGASLTFILASQAGQNFHLSSEISQHGQIGFKVIYSLVKLFYASGSMWSRLLV